MRYTRLLRPDSGMGGGSGTSKGVADPQAATHNSQLETVITRYREMVAAQTGLVPGMVRGETVEEIDASVQEARRAYGEISRQVAQQYEQEVPPGNPTRSSTTIGVETLKPEAKIALGLRRAEK